MTNRNQAVADEPELEEEEEKARSKMGFPIELYNVVETEAKRREIPVRALVREVVAQHFNYTGPLTAPRVRVSGELEAKSLDELRAMAATLVNDKGEPRIKDAENLDKTELVAAIGKAQRQKRNTERRTVFAKLLDKYGGNLDRIAALLEQDEDEDEEEDEEEDA